MKLIKTVNDKKVIDPNTLKQLPENGICVQKVSQYWKNRKNDGDVTITEIRNKNKKGDK